MIPMGPLMDYDLARHPFQPLRFRTAQPEQLQRYYEGRALWRKHVLRNARTGLEGLRQVTDWEKYLSETGLSQSVYTGRGRPRLDGHPAGTAPTNEGLRTTTTTTTTTTRLPRTGADNSIVEDDEDEDEIDVDVSQDLDYEDNDDEDEDEDDDEDEDEFDDEDFVGVWGARRSQRRSRGQSRRQNRVAVEPARNSRRANRRNINYNEFDGGNDDEDEWNGQDEEEDDDYAWSPRQHRRRESVGRQRGPTQRRGRGRPRIVRDDDEDEEVDIMTTEEEPHDRIPACFRTVKPYQLQYVPQKGDDIVLFRTGYRKFARANRDVADLQPNWQSVMTSMPVFQEFHVV
eukprot:TRINITY_DN6864_c0_g2_i2.p1 TRINITY_DN6864_c0_g2~~TRINITY_DN6864_c0_g2_i2.p1  ORF type:complete len:344 (-),score=85.64 TRINITY_DN6864_c0_g2_i2:732-1763(-)